MQQRLAAYKKRISSTSVTSIPANNTTNNNDGNKFDNVVGNKNNNSSTSHNSTANNINDKHEEHKPLIFANGSLNHFPINHILLDEGASVSLISKGVYNELLHHSGKSLMYLRTIYLHYYKQMVKLI
jgi:hypothetical protein